MLRSAFPFTAAMLSRALRRASAAAASAAASPGPAAPPLRRALSLLAPTDTFARRHLGPRDADLPAMLAAVSPALSSLEQLTEQTVPAGIRLAAPVELLPALTETQALAAMRAVADKNVVKTSLIGMGYFDTVTPGVVLRNVLESPAWYTSYTPYQAEISQGRLESLLNFQTMVVDLTRMDIANASLLDESTAAAEAMNLAFGHHGTKRVKFFVASDVHPQTLDVVRTRAEGVGIEVVVGEASAARAAALEADGGFCGARLQ